MLRNQRFCLDRIEARLEDVEIHIACDSNGRDLMDLPGSSARVPSNISSSKED